jgi:AraC-like DNA-binding protein/V8-like Glu-specific endopeptidase
MGYRQQNGMEELLSMGIWHKDERLDYFEIVDEKVKRNILSVAAVCMKDNLLDTGERYQELRVKNYGETYNLCTSEPFYYQPVAAGFMATGVLVKEDVVATAAHFANATNVKKLCFIFGYVMSDPISPVTRFPNENVYRGVEILHREYDVDGPGASGSDWALVRLDRKVEGLEIATLSFQNASYMQKIYSIGYPCGLPLKYAPGTVVKSDEKSCFVAEMDVFSGNGGSPVFSAETHAMVGIIYRGDSRDFRWVKDCCVSVIYPNNEIYSQGPGCTKVSEFIHHIFGPNEIEVERGIETASSANSEKQVFISYSNLDWDFVKVLKIDLENKGIKVWVDEKEAVVGGWVSQKVEEGIARTDSFCLVISNNSVQSNWVNQEYRKVLEKQTFSRATPRILPLLIGDVKLPWFLKKIKCVDFYKSYQMGLSSLLEAIKKGPVKTEAAVPIKSSKSEISTQDKKFLEEFLDVVEKNLSDPDFNIDVLCGNLLISRSTLFRMIKELTGETPNEFIQSYRLNRSTQLLEENYGNVSEVAEAVGFSDPYYFSKCFRKKFAQSPKSFQFSQLKKSQIVTRVMEKEDESKSYRSMIKFRSEFSIEDLDRELINRGALSKQEQIFNFKDIEGTPVREEIFEQVRELYSSVSHSSLNDVFKDLRTTELILIIRQKTDNINLKNFRGGGYANVCMDFFEIADECVRRNTYSVAAVCMSRDLSPDGNGYFRLRVKTYGPTFNLHKDELFFNQPIGAGPICTGVLVGKDVIATAAHFANEKNVSDLRFVFDFVMADPITPVTKVHKENIYKGVEILHRIYNPEGDWALVKLDRKVTDREIAVLSQKNIFYEQPVYVIGHPCGLPLKYAPGARVDDITGRYFRAYLDIYGSSSGSPVFCAETHELIGIVSRAKPMDFRWTGSCWVVMPYPKIYIDSKGAQCARASEFGKYL